MYLDAYFSHLYNQRIFYFSTLSFVLQSAKSDPIYFNELLALLCSQRRHKKGFIRDNGVA